MLDSISSLEGKRQIASLEIDCAVQAIAHFYVGRLSKVNRVGVDEKMRKRAQALETAVINNSASLDNFVLFCKYEADRCSIEPDRLEDVSVAAATECVKLLNKLASLKGLVLSYPDRVIPRAKRIALEANSL